MHTYEICWHYKWPICDPTSTFHVSIQPSRSKNYKLFMTPKNNQIIINQNTFSLYIWWNVKHERFNGLPDFTMRHEQEEKLQMLPYFLRKKIKHIKMDTENIFKWMCCDFLFILYAEAWMEAYLQWFLSFNL